MQMYLMGNNRTGISNSLGISFGCKGQTALVNNFEEKKKKKGMYGTDSEGL